MIKRRRRNRGFKVFLLIALVCIDQVSTKIPATGIQYFKDLLTLDLVYLTWSLFDKDLRLELGVLSLLSVLTNYLIIQDYINYTNYIYDYYPFIMQQLFYGCIGSFVIYYFRVFKNLWLDTQKQMLQ